MTVIRGLVSVVVPVRNRPEMLHEAAQSVFAQTHPEWELIVVDDGSTDGTGDAALALAGERPERVIVETTPGVGPGGAREIGRRRARGEFLQYLDSDDVLRPRKLERQVAALRADPAAGLAYGPVEVLSFDGKPRSDWSQLSTQRLDRMFPEFLRGRFWHTGAALLRRSVSDRAGPWSDLSLLEDWEYDCRIATFDLPLAFDEEVGVTIRPHASNRLGYSEKVEPWRLRQQARAHEHILAHARTARIAREAPEMAHFARSLFLLARKCGAAGEREACHRLLGLAKEASTRKRARGFDFVLFRALIAGLGVRAGSRLAERARNVVRGRAGEGDLR